MFKKKEIQEHGVNIGKTHVSCTQLILLCQQMITHRCFGLLSDIEKAECRHMNAYLVNLRRISKGIPATGDSMTDLVMARHELRNAKVNEGVQEEREYTIRQMQEYWSKEEIDAERNQRLPYDTKPSLTAAEEKELIYHNVYTETLLEDMNQENEDSYLYQYARIRLLKQFKPTSDALKKRFSGYDGLVHDFFFTLFRKNLRNKNFDNDDILSICQSIALEKCMTPPSSRLEQARCKSINADIAWFNRPWGKNDDLYDKQAEARSELMLLLWHKDDPVKKAELEAKINKIMETTLQQLTEEDRQCFEEEQLKKKEIIYKTLYTKRIIRNITVDKDPIDRLALFCSYAQALPTLQASITKRREGNFFNTSLRLYYDEKEYLSLCRSIALEKCTTIPTSNVEQARCKSIYADIAMLEKHLNKTLTYDDLVNQEQAKIELTAILWHKDDPAKKAALQAKINEITAQQRPQK